MDVSHLEVIVELALTYLLIVEELIELVIRGLVMDVMCVLLTEVTKLLDLTTFL
jgi:hypothetical protein